MIAGNATRGKPVGLLAFNLLAILIGLVAGLGAVVFRGLIAVFHNLLFLGQFSFTYDANVHTPPSPWGILGDHSSRWWGRPEWRSWWESLRRRPRDMACRK